MSYESIPNQPLIFSEIIEEGCPGCNSDFTQLIDFNDQLFYQIETKVCEDIYLKFYQVQTVGNWFVNGSFVGKSTPDNGIYSQQYYRNDLSVVFKLNITILTIEGELKCQMTMGTFQTFNSPGNYEFYLSTNSLSNLVAFNFSGLTFAGEFIVNSIEIIPTNALFTGLVDPETLTPIIRFNPTLTRKDQYLTCAINLADYEIPEGCYRLAYADYCENTCSQYHLNNPLFVSDFGASWNSTPIFGSSEWDYSLNSAEILFSFGLPQGQTLLSNSNELCTDVEYAITIVVSQINDCTLQCQIGSQLLFPIITSPGTYQFNVTPTGLGNFPSLLATDDADPNIRGFVQVTRFDVRMYKEWAVYDKYSPIVKIGEYNDECKFFKIEGCNAENQFGLGFSGTSFLPGVRLEGRKFRPQYLADIELFKYSSGKTVTTFYDRKKKWTFNFGRLPEYILDFLSTIFYYDNCYINGSLYAPSEDQFPDIEYDDADNLGNFSIDLISKNERIKKSICSASDANCLPTILDINDEPFLLSQFDDRLITQSNINLYQE
jgi:hypothetical protein